MSSPQSISDILSRPWGGARERILLRSGLIYGAHTRRHGARDTNGFDMPATTATKDDRRGVLLTLDRGIAVLEEIARQEGKATAKGLSETLGINVGTCYQLLRTLHVNGYITRLPGSRYGLGTRVAFLIDHYESSAAPPEELIAILRDLHASLGESVYVSLRTGTKLQVVACFEGTKAVRVGGIHVGYSDHPHARASGKCFMAFVPPEDLETYVDKERLTPITPATITDWTALLDDLEATRERGYALDLEEFNEGVGCISVPLFGPDGESTGALAISIPISGLDERRDELAARAIDAGRAGSRTLGYEGLYPRPA